MRTHEERVLELQNLIAAARLGLAEDPRWREAMARVEREQEKEREQADHDYRADQRDRS